jgi:phosphoglycerate dehydrogenase-like enzyme
VHLLIAIFGDVLAWTIPASEVARIRTAAPDLRITHAQTDDEMLAAVPDADLAFSWRIGPDVFPLARGLRWIHTPAAGVGAMLTPALRDSPVVLTNSRGVHAAPIAEHVIAVLIALLRRIPVAMRRQVAHVWAQNELAEPAPQLLRGRCLGLIGLGAIGSEVARLAVALGLRVIAVRRRPGLPPPAGVERVLGVDKLDELLAEADAVVLAAPLTDTTRALIGRAQIEQMKPDALLVNVGRGKLVDEDALDVVDHEPLAADSPLWDLENVLITPHMSGLRGDYWTVITDLFLDNLRRYRAGEPLRNVVDKAQGY